MINCLESRPIVTDKETRDEPSSHHGTLFHLSYSCPEVLWISPLPVYCTTDCLTVTALLHLLERTLRTGTFINKEKTMQFVSIE